MSVRVKINPELLQWACQRAGLKIKDLGQKASFKKLPEWEKGTTQPTFKQIEAFAKATYVPVGYLFLKKPPLREEVPVPDLRTIKNKSVMRPSPHLLSTIYLHQQRQYWYQKFLASAGYKPLKFIGSARIKDSIEKTATMMRQTLKFDLKAREDTPTWEEALTLFVKQMDDIGILVMINGVVGNDSSRKLDVKEFRGFALSDHLAPLVFINGQDFKSAQMFTLAHEMAHIWLGKSSLNNTTLDSHPNQEIEVWCNKVAAEFLVPLKALKKENIKSHPLESVPQLSKRYKTSHLVIIRRLFDAKYITREAFDKAYTQRLSQLGNQMKLKNKNQKGGGDFYQTMNKRVGQRFMHNLVTSTLEGNTLFTEAFDLLNITSTSTFMKIAKKLGLE